MPVINTQKSKGGNGGGNGTMTLLETDVYRMQIKRAVIEEDQFAEALADGKRPEKLVLTWEVSSVTEEQDEGCVGLAVWQRFNPYYGPVRDGGVSKFKAFIDSLREQGFLPDFDANMFDTDSLIGIEQRVSVEKYIKEMGVNKGSPGNRIASILPLKRKAQAAKPATAAPAKRNVPVAVEGGEDDEI